MGFQADILNRFILSVEEPVNFQMPPELFSFVLANREKHFEFFFLTHSEKGSDRLMTIVIFWI